MFSSKIPLLLFNHLRSNTDVTSSRMRLILSDLHLKPNDEKWAPINLKEAGKCCQSHIHYPELERKAVPLSRRILIKYKIILQRPQCFICEIKASGIQKKNKTLHLLLSEIYIRLNPGVCISSRVFNCLTETREDYACMKANIKISLFFLSLFPFSTNSSVFA